MEAPAEFDAAFAQHLTATAVQKFEELKAQRARAKAGHNVAVPLFSPPDSLFAAGGRGA